MAMHVGSTVKSWVMHGQRNAAETRPYGDIIAYSLWSVLVGRACHIISSIHSQHCISHLCNILIINWPIKYTLICMIQYDFIQLPLRTWQCHAPAVYLQVRYYQCHGSSRPCQRMRWSTPAPTIWGWKVLLCSPPPYINFQRSPAASCSSTEAPFKSLNHELCKTWMCSWSRQTVPTK